MKITCKLTLRSAWLFLSLSSIWMNTLYCTEPLDMSNNKLLPDDSFNKQETLEDREQKPSSILLNILNSSSSDTETVPEVDADIILSLNFICDKANEIIINSQYSLCSFRLPNSNVACFPISNPTKTSEVEQCVNYMNVFISVMEKTNKIMVDLNMIREKREEIVSGLFEENKKLITNVRTLCNVVCVLKEKKLINFNLVKYSEKIMMRLTKQIFVYFNKSFKYFEDYKNNVLKMFSKSIEMCEKNMLKTSTLSVCQANFEKYLKTLQTIYLQLFNDLETVIRRNWDDKCLLFHMSALNELFLNWFKKVERKYTMKIID